MRREHLYYLVCPVCKEKLVLSEIEKQDTVSIEMGMLQCSGCAKIFEILRHIPRFVPLENYASSFGFEWTKHARTQYDSYTGKKISQERFLDETKWPRRMENQLILEVGSGAGRFTEYVSSTGAMVVSMDYSYAVEENYASNGQKENVLIVQADLYQMPFPENHFDKLFCFGVLQHTPRVKEAFLALPRYLKKGGSLVIDVYRKPEGLKKYFFIKYWVRPITRYLPIKQLYGLCKWHIYLMWPISKVLNRLLGCKNSLNVVLLIADYRGVYNLPENMLKEWAILDTFDMLSAFYDYPQTLETVKDWFREAGSMQAEVKYSYHGLIVGRGIKVK